jgi:NAD(P)-dependent dehydrogenase (short-subunit alcohol dehydrogenase family)
MTSPSKNERVLLNDASRGLGFAIAEGYANRGAKVMATLRGPFGTTLHDGQETTSGLYESPGLFAHSVDWIP